MTELFSQSAVTSINDILSRRIAFVRSGLIRELAADILNKHIENYYIEYPFLKDYESSISKNHKDFIDEFEKRILLHKTDISCRFFGVEDFGQIISVSADGADSHSHGRMTLCVTTEQGRFFYKPHACPMDELFARLLKLFDVKFTHTPDMIIQPEYGIFSEIHHSPLESPADVDTYYYNFGYLTALLYVLGASDMHAENIIADGTFPVIIDYETLLTPEFNTALDKSERERQRGNVNNTSFFSFASDSVSRINILPFMLASRIQISPLITNLENGKSLPIFGDRTPNIFGHEESFYGGFHDGYHYIYTIREDILSVLSEYKNSLIRNVLRHTSYYATLMGKMYRPAALKDPHVRQEIFNKLYRSLSDKNDSTKAIVEYEIQSMLEGDIPIYHITPGLPVLFGYDENHILDDSFMIRTALGRAEKILKHMGEEDLIFQDCLIKNAVKHADVSIFPANYNSFAKALTDDENAAVSLKDAEEIFMRLYDERIIYKKDCYYWNNTVNQDHFICLHAKDLTGIYRYADALKQISRDPEIIDKANEVSDNCIDRIRELLAYAKANKDTDASIKKETLAEFAAHVLNGLGGSVAIASIIKDALDLIDEDIIKSINDITYGKGLSGLLVGIVNQKNILEDCIFNNLVKACADRILELRFNEGKNAPWRTLPNNKGTAGLFSGCAGIGLALSKAYEILGDEKYKSGAIEAFKYAEKNYSAKNGDFIDYEAHPLPIIMGTGLKSGLPGITLAVMEGGKSIPELSAFADFCKEACLKKKFYYEDNLLRGNAGLVYVLCFIGQYDRAEKMLRCMKHRSFVNGEYQCLPPGRRNYFLPSLEDGVLGVGMMIMNLNLMPSALFL